MPPNRTDFNHMLAMEDGFNDALKGRPRRGSRTLEITAAQAEGYEEGYRKGLEQRDGYRP